MTTLTQDQCLAVTLFFAIAKSSLQLNISNSDKLREKTFLKKNIEMTFERDLNVIVSI